MSLLAVYFTFAWGCNLPSPSGDTEDATESLNEHQDENDSAGADTPVVGEGENEDLEPTVCEDTATNIEGPFYRSDAPWRNDLTSTEMTGTRLRVHGKILNVECAAVTGALIDIWQADHIGDYDHVSDAYLLRGRFYNQDDGGYEFLSIHPGRYLTGSTYRPAHIHVQISAPGYQTLTTQLYFADDPYNESDSFIVDSLIMPISLEDGEERCAFDFVLKASD